MNIRVFALTKLNTVNALTGTIIFGRALQRAAGAGTQQASRKELTPEQPADMFAFCVSTFRPGRNLRR
jgi:hypothetical protein